MWFLIFSLTIRKLISICFDAIEGLLFLEKKNAGGIIIENSQWLRDEFYIENLAIK